MLGGRHSCGMGVALGATDTWGSRLGMRVVKTTPSAAPSRSRARQASRSRKPLLVVSTPAVTARKRGGERARRAPRRDFELRPRDPARRW
ncbi:MAG: hypothetical protein M3315_11345 [Actinomycetota bacterium]|nr:hypothetical protein [Actinomycetota bacterium]